MNRRSFKGTGQVYSFTLGQLIKNKGNIVTFVILALVVSLGVPVMTLLSGGGAARAGVTATAYLYNETEYELDYADMLDGYPGLTLNMANLSAPVDDISGLGETGVYVHIADDGGRLRISLASPEESALSESDLSAVQGAMSAMLDAARYRQLNVTPEQMDIVMTQYSTNVMTTGEYAQEEGLGFDGMFSIQYAYAIIVMVISMFSAIYIIRAVIEEKSSKLVELLMVSVKPLALIVGKILAVMTYIFAALISLAALFGISCLVSGLFLNAAAIGTMISGMGIDLSLLNLSPLTVLVVLVSLVLGYLTFSILAGLFGTACSSMDEVESANMSVVLLVMAGFMVSCFAPAFNGAGLSVAVSLVPVVSTFCAPVLFITGKIGIVILLLSWIIQAAVVLLLALFCAKVYSGLIMHSGGRVKLGQMIALSRGKAIKEAN